MKVLSIITAILIISGSGFSQTIDSKATKETVALFNNMKNLSKKHTLFAHQHATEYGHGWKGDENRSDVKSVCGSHPAMVGGEAHDKYMINLDGIGEWALSLEGADGTLAPVIFRPFHEFDGGWFWWGHHIVPKRNL